jgi:hypothetical protein
MDPPEGSSSHHGCRRPPHGSNAQRGTTTGWRRASSPCSNLFRTTGTDDRALREGRNNGMYRSRRRGGVRPPSSSDARSVPEPSSSSSIAAPRRCSSTSGACRGRDPGRPLRRRPLGRATPRRKSAGPGRSRASFGANEVAVWRAVTNMMTRSLSLDRSIGRVSERVSERAIPKRRWGQAFCPRIFPAAFV